MPTPPPSSTLPLLQRRTMRVLVVAQLLGALGLAAGGTAGALLAEHLTGSAAAAGLSMLVLGSGIGVVAVARVMRRSGRRAGLTAAYLAGTVGAALVVAAAGWGSWPLLLAGGGFVLLGLVAAAPCVLLLAVIATGGRRGGIPPTRSGSIAQPTVKVMPD